MQIRIGLVVVLVSGCGDIAVPTGLTGVGTGTVSTPEPEDVGTTDATPLTPDPGDTGTTTEQAGTTTSGGLEPSSSEGTTGSTGEGLCPPPFTSENVVLDADFAAGYTVAQIRVDDPADPTYHLISIYEPRYFGHEAPIWWNLPGNNTLVLHSATPTHFRILQGPDGELDEIVLYGPSNQITAPAEIAIDARPQLNHAVNCEIVAPGAEDQCEVDAITSAVEGNLGVEIASADYTYVAHHFEYERSEECGGAPGDSPLSCQEVNGPSGAEAPACVGIMAEESYCATLTGSAVELIGTETGDTCTLVDLDQGVSPWHGGLGWIGNDLYACDGTVIRIDTTTGAVEDSGVGCAMVTDFLGDIVTTPPGAPWNVDRFPTYDALLAGLPSAQYTLTGLHGLTMASDGPDLSLAWFIGFGAERWDLVTETRIADAPFLCWDDFISGYDIHDGLSYVLNDDMVFVFNTDTGHQQRQVTVSTTGSGLACR